MQHTPKVYDSIISVHDVTNKVLPGNSNYIPDAVLASGDLSVNLSFRNTMINIRLVRLLFDTDPNLAMEQPNSR